MATYVQNRSGYFSSPNVHAPVVLSCDAGISPIPTAMPTVNPNVQRNPRLQSVSGFSTARTVASTHISSIM